jgi:hypothetical protein
VALLPGGGWIWVISNQQGRACEWVLSALDWLQSLREREGRGVSFWGTQSGTVTGLARRVDPLAVVKATVSESS